MVGFSDTWFFVVNFFYNWSNMCPLLLIIRQYFLTINFIAFGFIILSDLNSDPKNLVEILFIRVFLVDCLTRLNISLIPLKISKLFFVTISSNKLKTKLLFYSIQYFCRCVHFRCVQMYLLHLKRNYLLI